MGVDSSYSISWARKLLLRARIADWNLRANLKCRWARCAPAMVGPALREPSSSISSAALDTKPYIAVLIPAAFVGRGGHGIDCNRPSGCGATNVAHRAVPERFVGSA